MDKKKLTIIAGAVILFIVDRWLKNLAASGFTMQGAFGQFVLFKNYGIIFSWPLPTLVATMLMVAAAGLVYWLIVQAIRRHDMMKLLGATFMLVGAISNMYDRLTLGYIIDWAYLGRWWPVFNLADVWVAVGLVLYLTAEHKKVQ